MLEDSAGDLAIVADCFGMDPIALQSEIVLDRVRPPAFHYVYDMIATHLKYTSSQRIEVLNAHRWKCGGS